MRYLTTLTALAMLAAPAAAMDERHPSIMCNLPNGDGAPVFHRFTVTDSDVTDVAPGAFHGVMHLRIIDNGSQTGKVTLATRSGPISIYVVLNMRMKSASALATDSSTGQSARSFGYCGPDFAS